MEVEQGEGVHALLRDGGQVVRPRSLHLGTVQSQILVSPPRLCLAKSGLPTALLVPRHAAEEGALHRAAAAAPAQAGHHLGCRGSLERREEGAVVVDVEVELGVGAAVADGGEVKGEGRVLRQRPAAEIQLLLLPQVSLRRKVGGGHG